MDNITKKSVDLHIHSRYSDGNYKIEEIIERAAEKQLAAISITDHDCIDGIARGQMLGEAVGIEVIPGMELSCEFNNKDIHVLGYDFDYEYPELVQKLTEFKEARFYRAKQMVKNLNEIGLDLRFDTVEEIAGEGSIGRPHIAEALRKEELVETFREAFDKYIGYESPVYVEKMHFSPEESFQLIRNAGGVPVLAHPNVTQCDPYIPQFIQEGLMGLEVWHMEHSYEAQRHYNRYCEKRNLVKTGGSDCHGSITGKSYIGALSVPYSCVGQIREAKETIRRAA